mgnify:CR=1 FL=1
MTILYLVMLAVGVSLCLAYLSPTDPLQGGDLLFCFIAGLALTFGAWGVYQHL